MLNEWLLKVLKYFKNELQGKEMELVKIVLLLRKINLLSDLSASTLQVIAENVAPLEFLAGQKIFSEGDAPDGFYMIAKSKVEIKKDNQVLNTLSDTDFFGELALVDDAPRFATATAVEDSQIFFLDKIEFNRLVDDSPEILRAVVKTIIKYLRQQAQR